jgi:hypothetical protein
VHSIRVRQSANEVCLRTDKGTQPAALAAPVLLALDDEFVAGGLCAASSVQAAMRFWLHGHNELPVYVARCINAMVAAACVWCCICACCRHSPVGMPCRNDEAGRFAAGGGSLLTAVAAAVEQWRQSHVVSPQK